MDRREFIKKSLTLGIALSAASKIPVFDLVKLVRAEPMPDPTVSVGEGKNYKNLVIDVVDKLGGMKKFVKQGDVVVVKPNIAWDSSPELGANTHPIVAKTVVELCLDAGAQKVKIFDRTANEPRRAYKTSGIQDAIETIKDKKVDMKHVENHRFVPIKIKKGVGLKEWPFYKEALDADKLINVPVAKHHSLSKLTIGMKNIMGVIGGNRGDIHRGLDQNLVDINTVVKSDLTIVDATRIMTSNGPTGGLLQYVKVMDKVIASADIVAVDSYTATLFDMKGTDLGFVNIAHKTGLGEKDIERMKII
jgi:uncharacterized protein (DUF362 family)